MGRGVAKELCLRRLWRPYLGFIIPLLALIPLLGYASFKTHDLRALEPIALGSLLISWLGYMGTRYRIYMENERVTQKAFRKKDVVISIKDIKTISMEASDAATLVKMQRPSNRITIYSEEKFIDVSLKHFKYLDIQELMHRIKVLRPDLDVPFTKKARAARTKKRSRTSATR